LSAAWLPDDPFVPVDRSFLSELYEAANDAREARIAIGTATLLAAIERSRADELRAQVRELRLALEDAEDEALARH
jgi:hypothetical protein